jgi:hypothetical protein
MVDSSEVEQSRKQARMEELQLEKMLKDIIVGTIFCCRYIYKLFNASQDQARLFYGPHYPASSAFDIATTKSYLGKDGKQFFDECLIVFPSPSSYAEWTFIDMSSDSVTSVVEALECLQGKLQGVTHTVSHKRDTYRDCC